jgi:glycerol-3-phosphate O-acyltransferase/dihydroxyacetone phosphate acyltransferase
MQDHVRDVRILIELLLRYGAPITMDAFEEQFLSEEEGANKLAVKRLTKTLELEMMKLTVNAPDW